ncbi:MAG: serine hydrolase [Bacteroidetes bacterium]|nr:serine hydrolase [Bacteroidota bacterium]
MLVLTVAAGACHRPSKGREVVPPFSGVDSSQVDIVLAGLSLEEKIGQLIVWEAPMNDSAGRADVFQKIQDGMAGGLLLEGLHLADFMYVADSLRRTSKLPLFFSTRQKVSLHNQFAGLQQFPLPATMGAIDSVELTRFLERHYLRQCKALGINLALNPVLKSDDLAAQSFDFQTFENEGTALAERSIRMASYLQSNRILAVGDGFFKLEFIENDSLRDLALSRFLTHTQVGLGGLMVNDGAFKADTLEKTMPRFIKKYLNNYLDFSGLMTVELAPGESPRQKLLEGADLLFTPDAGLVFQAIDKLLTTGQLTETEINERARRVLIAKAWVNGGKLPVTLSVVPQDTTTRKPVKFVSISEKRLPNLVHENQPRPANLDANVDETVCYFEDPRWSLFIGRLFENAVILARDDSQILPLKKIYDTDYQVFEYSQRTFQDFENYFSKYANFKTHRQLPSASGELSPVVFSKTAKAPVAIVLLDSLDLQPGFHKRFIESLNELSGQAPVVLVNFGNPKNLRHFAPGVSCIQIFEKNNFTEAYTAQMLFGGVASEGRMPVGVDENLKFGTSVRRQPVRLGFATAEKTGIASERLVGINAIAGSAIGHGVFPGCQVAVAKDGQIIFSQSFGHQTYGKTSQPVETTDLYDIASVTKVAATTLAVMKLVEKGELDLQGKVADYLSVPAWSAIGNIKIRDLLLHNSGLQAQMPLARFFSGKNVPAKGCNDYFCRKRKGDYNVKVSDGLYFRGSFQDTILKRVFKLPVAARPRFRYSDVNYFLLKKIVETRTNTGLDDYVFENIYRPLGLRNITYGPLQKFSKSRIVPTEQDNYWRKTLVHGYVHDPAVALMGGVGGSAGVFSNAEDLAVLLQMLLDGGGYGGEQFFEKTTVDDFTTNKYTNHRGLGFDKPAKRRYPTYSAHASPKSFGHTGFTGTCVWVDPEQRLVYVFLSNRVNPSSRNGKIFTEAVRSRIHDVVYNAVGTFDGSLPELEGEEIEESEGAGD